MTKLAKARGLTFQLISFGFGPSFKGFRGINICSLKFHQLAHKMSASGKLVATGCKTFREDWEAQTIYYNFIFT